ncbi:MAG: hypothetical protein NC923_01775 [Candidatus Omnitrophica bacterium]|nr:hypothetical protein [Candidatus Omnitrophota bacterium]
MNRVLSIFTIFIIAVFVSAVLFPIHAGDEKEQLPVLLIFYSESCHRCQLIKAKLMPYIEKEFSGRIRIEYRDIAVLENYKLLLALEEQYKPDIEKAWPVFFMRGRFVNGLGRVGDNLVKMISDSLADSLFSSGRISGVELVQYFKRFTPLLIVTVGLVDGVNPCAFTVIAFFISFLALQGYKRKELWVIGLTFIFAVFLSYVMIGLGLFGFLYRFKGFWMARKIFNILVGSLSIIFSMMAIYDVLKYRNTQKTEGLLLQLPQTIKNQIHKVIGIHFRRTKDNTTQAAADYTTYKLAAVAFVTGVIVSLLEAVCTGQTYLPTIAFIFSTTNLKAQALGYLLLYNAMFVVPLFTVFLLALLGVTSAQFSVFLKSRLILIKVAMAFLFFFIGIFLIWRS